MLDILLYDVSSNQFFGVNLHAHCSGYEANLTTRCEKVIGGIEWYCPKPLSNTVTGCWEEDFEKGN